MKSDIDTNILIFEMPGSAGTFVDNAIILLLFFTIRKLRATRELKNNSIYCRFKFHPHISSKNHFELVLLLNCYDLFIEYFDVVLLQ